MYILHVNFLTTDDKRCLQITEYLLDYLYNTNTAVYSTLEYFNSLFCWLQKAKATAAAAPSGDAKQDSGKYENLV